MPASDQELLQATAAGNGKAFGELIERHAQELFRLAQWLLGNRADAEDAMQETLAGAFKAARSFDGRAAVKTWLTRILIRQTYRLRGKRRKFRQTLSLDAPEENRQVLAQAAMGVSAALSVDQRLDIAQLIQTLPEEHREVIVLREMQQMSYDEIALALGVPHGTVESRLHRARASLKQKLSEYR